LIKVCFYYLGLLQKDKIGKSALQIAEEMGLKEIVDLLK